MKLCRTCSHCQPDNFFWPRALRWKHARCTLFRSKRDDQYTPVWGRHAVDEQKLCVAAREIETDCGADGRYWHAKPERWSP